MAPGFRYVRRSSRQSGSPLRSEASRRQSKGVSAYVLTARDNIDLLPKVGPAPDIALREHVQKLLAIGGPVLTVHLETGP